MEWGKVLPDKVVNKSWNRKSSEHVHACGWICFYCFYSVLFLSLFAGKVNKKHGRTPKFYAVGLFFSNYCTLNWWSQREDYCLSKKEKTDGHISEADLNAGNVSWTLHRSNLRANIRFHLINQTANKNPLS